ncbi:MAG TPA: hypothetical protein VM285_01050 [Polyangia bacterium]|nr:hypothetical protein [Polyangia bacterium]
MSSLAARADHVASEAHALRLRLGNILTRLQEGASNDGAVKASGVERADRPVGGLTNHIDNILDTATAHTAAMHTALSELEEILS